MKRRDSKRDKRTKKKLTWGDTRKEKMHVAIPYIINKQIPRLGFKTQSFKTKNKIKTGKFSRPRPKQDIEKTRASRTLQKVYKYHINTSLTDPFLRVIYHDVAMEIDIINSKRLVLPTSKLKGLRMRPKPTNLKAL